MKLFLTACLSIALCCHSFSPTLAQNEGAGTSLWPEISGSAQPWTRWWWHGSAVDKENLSRCLENYRAAGLGGVEITCIYGVKGAEDRNLQYLSPEWLDAVGYALAEANRLGMQVDLPPGSGWRMGGPKVTIADGNEELTIEKIEVAAGESLQRDFVRNTPLAVRAYHPSNKSVSLLEDADSSGKLSWTPPADSGSWTVYVLGSRKTREKVKRPAPGGEGLNINPYSLRSITHFLDDFANRTAKLESPALRASFHDSFEYEGNWSDSFLAKFAENRGYRLEDHLPELMGVGDRDIVARVKCDYRETMSDLVHDELIVPWVEWCHKHELLARNQAHGSPGNWLDLYSACDIPETESFGPLEKADANPLVQQFASSAAHVAGHKLVASESATWLGEHFTVTLAQVKERLDRQMLAGINHVIYHGTAYSPEDAAWPGWVFYASTQLNPQNPIWRDFPALNEYVARCQSLLQAGQPANDVLIYWPIHDVWHDAEGLRKDLRVHNSPGWFGSQPIGKLAAALTERGVSFDYVSDKQVQTCRATEGQINAPGASYRALLVPAAEHMPTATLAHLGRLAENGGKIIFVGKLPSSPPGLLTEEKQASFEKAKESVASDTTVVEFTAELVEANLLPQENFCIDSPLKFIRRRLEEGYCYFIKNSSEKNFQGWIELQVPWKAVVQLDPLTEKAGTPAIREGEKIRMELAAGATIFLRTFDAEKQFSQWAYQKTVGEPVAIDGPWEIKFIAGGPELPAKVTAAELKSWTELAGEAGETFAGTAAYSTRFSVPEGELGSYRLSLGEIGDSARVFLNDELIGTLIVPPFAVELDLDQPENNLRIEVTNVAANRIRDLDRRGIVWRIFHDINLVNINYRPFDASNWPVRPAGILGPVTLQKTASSPSSD